MLVALHTRAEHKPFSRGILTRSLFVKGCLVRTPSSSSLPAVPFAGHIEGSIPVPSGQPRSISLAHELVVPRSTSQNASRECA